MRWGYKRRKLLMYAPQMARYGGMEQHVCGLAQRAAAAGIETTLLTTSNSLAVSVRIRLKAFGVDYRELEVARGKASQFRKLLWLLATTLRMRRKQWNVIYTNGQSALARVVWSASKVGATRIHHHHTAADREEQKTWHPAYRTILKDASKVVACSKFSQENICESVGRNDVTFLPYLTPDFVDGATICEKGYAATGKIHLGYFGRFVSTKGIETICQLSLEPALLSVVWELYGAGDEYPASFFEKYPNVVLRGEYGSMQDYRAALLRLDGVVLLSSHNEGMPLSLIEAMAVGVPWIATDRGGTRELKGSASGSEIISQPAAFPAVCAAMVRFVAKLRGNEASRLAQRAAYESHFLPGAVGELWLSAMSGSLAE